MCRSFFLSTLAALIAYAPFLMAQEIAFVEKFVLSENRATVLGELIPGTEDYYFYHTLHYQHVGDRDNLATTLTDWKTRYPQSPRREIIENRQALLDYDRDPKGTLAYLTSALNLRFNDQQDRPKSDPGLPSTLAPESITLQAFAERHLATQEDLSRLNILGLEAITRAQIALKPSQKQQLLDRVTSPDFPNLTNLVLEDLGTRESQGFGSRPIHRLLTLAQLDTLKTRKGDLLANQAFVETYAQRLMPGADSAWARDNAEREAYYERLHAFTSTLPAAFNSLKAHVLYQRLDLARARGDYSEAAFLDYLALPRRTSYIEPRLLESESAIADLNGDFSNITKRPPIGSDEGLIRDYLLQLLKDASNYERYTPFLKEEWVKPLFAETKIVNGIGDQQKWFSMLSPTAYQALLKRVDVDFAPENPTETAIDDDVRLYLTTKNVSTLMVRVFEINTLNYYLAEQQEISTDLNLDGLVPNETLSYDYPEPPLRRVRREFTFPKLTGKRGAWMIEFVGNGISSRALVRKGGLHYLNRSSVEGEVLTIRNEANAAVPGAAVWLGNRAFTADEHGEVLIPFSSQAGTKTVVLADSNGFASLDQLELPGENYSLQAGIALNREQLIPGQEATVLIRPTLLLGGHPVTLTVLGKTQLTISTTDLDGIPTTQEVPDFALSEAKESTHHFVVPKRLAALTVTLSSKVKRRSDGAEVDLSASQRFEINAIDRTAQTSDFHLLRDDQAWRILWLGKTGEPQPKRPVVVEIRHEGFNDDLNLPLQTDANGEILLGSLPNIARVKVSAEGVEAKRWTLPQNFCHYPENLHAVAGDPVQIPYVGDATQITSEDFALIEIRDEVPLADELNKLSLSEGFLNISGLEAGDYRLTLKRSNQSIQLAVAKGNLEDGVIVGGNRELTIRNEQPLSIQKVERSGDFLEVSLANANTFTRVHITASRFVPGFPLGEQLDQPIPKPNALIPAYRPNLFQSGRNIGDEYRYIIERRYAAKYPGNMLPRPGVILNPWEQRDTSAQPDELAAAESLKRQQQDMLARRSGLGLERESLSEEGFTDSSSLDFLPTDAVLLSNLRPDANGNLRIPIASLANRQDLQIAAINPENSLVKHYYLKRAEKNAARDLRLPQALDNQVPLAEHKAATIVAEGETFHFTDAASSALEIYDTLGKVSRYFVTSTGNTDLSSFDFITRWPTFTSEEKHTLYSEHACHELHLFLKRKDPTFFKEVVEPYLRNKKEQTFMDHYVLGEDVSGYLAPWRFARLNIAEKALLAQRLGGENGQSIVRHLNEIFNQLPPQPEIWDERFTTALFGLRLGQDQFNIGDLPQLADSKLQMSPEAAPAPAAAAKPLAKKQNAVRLAGLDDGLAVSEENLAEAHADEEPPSDKAFYFKRARDLGELERGFFRPLDATKEWAEHHYYHVPLAQMNEGLIPMNAFWNAYASWSGKGAFVTEHFIDATSSTNEMLLALALLDLPFESGKNDMIRDGANIQLTAATGLLLFHKELREAPVVENEGVLVSENFYQDGQRYIQDGNIQSDRFIKEEFLKATVYGGEVVLTNTSSRPQTVTALFQIPASSVPVAGSKPTNSRTLVLAPYETQKVDYRFYFPHSGEFKHYPVHVSRDGKTLNKGEAFSFHVVDEPSRIDARSWAYVSQWASPGEVLDFLQKESLAAVDLSRIAWRLREPSFYKQVIAVLEQRHTYAPSLYRYAILHNDKERITEFLLQDAFAERCGRWLNSPIAQLDPVARQAYQQLEYSPLVNPRTHILGGQRKILNEAVYRQYHAFLDILQYKPSLDDADRLSIVYYLFLQDRVEEALAHLSRIQSENLVTSLQYDYFRAYAALYQGDPATARAIAQGYANYPVPRWQTLFSQITEQLHEIEGQPPSSPGNDRDRQLNQLAATEPQFHFLAENGRLRLNYQNLNEIQVHYYEMDIEFLFSTSPFVTQDASRFSVIKPNLAERFQLDPAATEKTFPLPAALQGKNVLIEIIGANQKKTQAYFSNQLDVQLAEAYGHLQVRDIRDKRPLSKVYIKVYARHQNGEIAFYKDGYTDLRGKFDYASLNGDSLSTIERFSLLVLSETEGATMQEASVPQQ